MCLFTKINTKNICLWYLNNTTLLRDVLREQQWRVSVSFEKAIPCPNLFLWLTKYFNTEVCMLYDMDGM